MVFFIFVLFSSNVFGDMANASTKKYINYLDISFNQGFRKLGDYYSGSGNIDSNFGFLYTYDEKNSFFLNLGIYYNGDPVDFKRDIDERILDNSITTEWRRKIDKNLLRFCVAYSDEKIKQGTSNSFDDNIYNNKRKGIGLNYDINYEKGVFGAGVIYRRIEFPNYTDLLTEFKNQNSLLNDSGVYDNDLYRFEIRWKHKKYFFLSDFVYQHYLNQRVVNYDASYGQKQKNISYDFKLGIERKLYIFDFYPSVSLSFYRSNQNFLRFNSITDINPVFLKDAYSYDEYSFALPFSYFLKDITINLEFRYTYRAYKNRNARNSNNEYISEKQKNKKEIFALTISKKMNEYLEFLITYFHHHLTSNNKYDVYLPLNYTSDYIAVGYRINY